VLTGDTLRVPDAAISGVEIKNGGVSVHSEDCDFALNAFLSEETVASIIANAPRRTLTDRRHGSRLVAAEMGIWKFSDGSGEPRFFVTSVHSMLPVVSPRNAEEREVDCSEKMVGPGNYMCRSLSSASREVREKFERMDWGEVEEFAGIAMDFVGVALKSSSKYLKSVHPANLDTAMILADIEAREDLAVDP
jgi:hypothetical protein